MGILSTLNFISNHPLNKKQPLKAMGRFVAWQFRTKINSEPLIYSFTDKSKLIIRKGMSAATGNLYCGLYELSEMGFLLHFLRKEDIFVDVGANIGSFTVLASAHVGSKTIAFEPVPSTFSQLQENVIVNKVEEKVQLYNIALSSKKGSVNFTNTLDAMNHVSQDNEQDIITVVADTLDNAIPKNVIPTLLKIDVEGYETEVIKGSENLLDQAGLKAIIIELPGIGARYGFDEDALHAHLLVKGFSPFQYNPINRSLIQVEKFGSHNTIYIRDRAFVENRIASAPPIKIHGITL